MTDQVQWRRFDYDHKQETAPPTQDIVWVYEEYYERGVTLGYFDGFTFRLWTGTDDCSVTWWAPVTRPPLPPGEPS